MAERVSPSSASPAIEKAVQKQCNKKRSRSDDVNEDSEKRLKLWETKDAVPNTEHLQWLTKENEQLKAEVQRLTLLSQHSWNNDWDMKAMEGITCDRSVFLIRHGEYLKSVLPQALTSLGIEQARKTGRRLNKHLIKGTIQTKRIVHSGLHRAIQTAKEIQTALDKPIELKEDITLNEGSPSDDSQRFEAAFRKYFFRSNNVEENVLVCHANLIRYMICRCLQITPDAWDRMAVYHCSVTNVKLHSSGCVTLQHLNSVGHL